MKGIVLFAVLLVSYSLFAQQPLSQSLRTSANRYIYRISPSEATTLYKTNLQKIDERYLHTLIDSFPINSESPRLPDGNYLFVHANGHQLQYQLIALGDLQAKTINNKRNLMVSLHTKKGTIIPDAAVTVNGRPLPYDPTTQTYARNRYRKGGSLQILHQHTAYHFPLERYNNIRWKYRTIKQKVLNSFPLKYVTQTIRKWQGRSYRYTNYFRHPLPYEEKFRGFMSFNKPIYKPGDTVKLKAFVMNRKGKGLTNKLLVRLTSSYLDIDTLIAVVKPYRAGGYTHEFVLNDSLDLDLDDEYLITLEEERSRKYDLSTYDGDLDDEEYVAKRKVVMRGKFQYEEYELNALTFTARADKKEHHRGEPQALFLKATDENDLPIMDGRLQITVLTNPNSQTITNQPSLFLPDTLWTHSQALETVGETKINLPDSIFPDASFNYQIACVLLNSNNERHSQQLYSHFINQPAFVTFDLRQDSIYMDYRSRDTSLSVPATVYAFTDDEDTLEVTSVQLPAAVKLNPYATDYMVEATGTTAFYDIQKKAGMVSAMATRTKDSVFILLNNPHRLPVWYTLFAGKKVVARGQSDTLFLKAKTRTPKNYFLSLQYLVGNAIHQEEYTIAYQDKLLNVSVHAPQVVYPGQTATIEVSVADANGKGVAGADVTAYAYTRKFTNASAPNVPYLGKTYPLRNAGPSFQALPAKGWKGLQQLNWERWSKEMGLDSIEYYQFLYTKELYRNTEATKDSTTQLAPFVVLKGKVQPIHLLYIDEKPVFFSHSQHLQRYSFPITPGLHSLRIRTQDRVITLTDISVPKGVKTILSINGDTTNKAISLQPAPDTLTAAERTLLTKYTLLIDNNYGEHFTYIEQENSLFLLPKTTGYGYAPFPLVGPLAPRTANLVVHNRFKQWFDVEGGYLYQIRPGLIKQKQVNAQTYIRKWLSAETPYYNFSELALTAQEVDSLWKNYLDNRSANEDLFINAGLLKQGNGALRIGIQPSKAHPNLFVKNLILFRKDDTDFIRVYKGNTRELGYLAPGTYRLYLLLKNDHYLLQDSIYIQRDGLNYYTINTSVIKPSDSISRKLATIIESRELKQKSSNAGLLDIQESFNSGFLDVSTFNNTLFGQVRDEKGNPIPFATVSVKGTRQAVQTDAQGYYRINAPEKGTLVVSAVGFAHMEQAIAPGHLNISLVTSSNQLQEVVVTGYGTQRKSSVTGAVSVQNVLSGRVAGIQIRGVNSFNAAATPLIVIDGILSEGTMNDLDPSELANVTVLKGEAATALYGARGANGVILITTKKAAQNVSIPGEAFPAAGNTLRRHFRDDAYWQPTLRTDKDGNVRFKTTFPDDITNWRTIAIAMASQKRTGYAEGLIRSFKPISVTLALPQFAVAGDSINVIGKTLNYGSDSIRVARRMKINDSLSKEGWLQIRNAHIDTLSLTVANNDSVRLQMTIEKEGGYFDGEERTIPVFKQGVLETKGFFAALEGDTTLTIQMDPSLGKVTLHAEASLLPILEEEAECIRRYEYLCNEQLASKLKALLSQKKIALLLKKDFQHEAAIQDIMARLNNNKTGNLWGWWVNNEAAPWISLHVVEALLQAGKEGYTIQLHKQPIIDNLVFNLESYRGHDQLLSLHLLQQLEAKVDYKRYIDTLEKRADKLSLYERLRLIELKQKAGIHQPVDSIAATAKYTLFGNLYWGEEGYKFFDNSIQNTILMYRILKRAGGHETTLRKVRNYFLEKRKGGQWRNTYESSLILETILPDILVNQERPRPATLWFLDDSPEVINAFPYHKEISTETTIRLRKEGELPVYFTAYQQYWNSKPAPVADAFTVTTVFEKGGDGPSFLKAGEPVSLKVQLTAKGDADYVMIEVPIPAGCSYKDKPQPYINNEVHREYFKNKVSIFCSRLKQGSYTFTIPLLPRYTGRYHLNPAKAEMMYFPVFYGREGMQQISIR